jgi:hypothetical protein
MLENVDDDAKLQALREAAREGREAMERGEAKRFCHRDALIGHLDGLARIAIEGEKLQKP